MSSEEIPTVILRNGYEHAEPLVRVAMMSLRHLMVENPVAFYEFVCLCRDDTHKLFGNTDEILRDRRLIEERGERSPSIQPSLREITLAATEGDELEMKLVNPIKGADDE